MRPLKLGLCLLVGIIALFRPSPAFAAHPLDKIFAQIESGQVAGDEVHRLLILGLFDSKALGPEFQGDGSTKQATHAIAKLKAEEAQLSPENRALLVKYGFFKPPTYTSRSASNVVLDNEQILTVGNFKIHYTLVGDDATNATYLQALQDTIPVVQDTYFTQLGYPFPPLNGKTHYDIYLKNLGAQKWYGYVAPSTQASVTGFAAGDNPNTAQVETIAYTSYAVIENDLVEPVFKSPTPEKMVQNLRATFVHEFFHAIQFGIYLSWNSNSERWLIESTATFMEEAVYPDSNISYEEYLDDWFLYPDAPLITTDGSLGFSPAAQHEYGSIIWWSFLDTHETGLRDGLKDLFFRYGSGQAGSFSAEWARLFSQWLTQSESIAAHRFSLANAAQVSPGVGLAAEIGPITHKDADSFLPLASTSKTGGLLGIERSIHFTGTSMTHDAGLAGEGNSRLGILASDTLMLSVSAPLAVTLTSMGEGTLTMSAVVGTGPSARLISSSGTPPRISLDEAEKVFLIITNIGGSNNPRYTLSLEPNYPKNCQVDRVTGTGNYPIDVGDLAVLRRAVNQPGTVENCFGGACNFDGVFSNPEPSEGDFEVLLNAVILESSSASVCQ